MKRIVLGCLLVAAALSAITPDAAAARRVSYVGDNLWMVTYSVGLPLEDTKEYTARTSWLGFSIEGRQFVTTSMTLGISAGWQTFDEKAYRSSDQGSTTLTGTQFRYQNTFPALATLHLYFGSPDEAKFYFGAGAGTYWIERRTEVGLYAFTEENWHWGLAPEVGFVIPSGSTSWVILGRYNYAFEAGGMEAQEWVTVQLGIQYN